MIRFSPRKMNERCFGPVDDTLAHLCTVVESVKG